MKQEIDVYDFERAFKDMDRDYFSWDGYQALYDYYDQFEDFSLDVIAICCDVTEYTEDEFISNYKSYLTVEEFKNDSGYTDEDEDLQEEYLKALSSAISFSTYLIELDNGSFLVWEF